ncbi:MAG: hypoxanthine phosphoribosyltransferase [Bacillota bacterium]|jgi:hypoxanthine phosphoribosyltransferase|nr:hypoxanthine phosphoribosyltransferase [Bacillota bacterium]MDY0118779.1 hypoxanthine phosphoribosyltransferase [Bacilli bacterium]
MGKNRIGKILVTEEQIVARCKELGAKITKDYQGKTPIIVGLLTGAVPFVAELIKHIDGEIVLDFMSVKSYQGNIQQSKLAFIHDITTCVQGEDVIIVDDVADSGLTLSAIVDHMLKKGAKSVKLCCLLDKPDAKKHPVHLDYVGFTIENDFVIGFGLDYNGRYRNLPYIALYVLD